MDNKKIKNLPVTVFCISLVLTGCATMAGLERGVTKPWVEIEMKKRNLEGSVYDVCYKLDLYFPSKEARNTIDTYAACIDTCCWYSKKKEVVLDFNQNFKSDLALYGIGHKFTVSKLKIKMHRTKLVHFMTAKAEPEIINKKGYIKISHDTIIDDERIIELDKLEKLKEKQRFLAQKRKTELAKKRQTGGKEKKRISEDIATGESYALALVKRKISPKLENITSRIKNYAAQNNLIANIEGETWITKSVSRNKYKVTCIIRAEVGAIPQQVQEKWISCGTWSANTKTRKITPADNTAKQLTE